MLSNTRRIQHEILGKLFAITVLLTGLNIHSFAYAAPAASTDNTQDKVSKKSPNSAADNGAKVKGTPAQSVEKISDNTKNVAADSSVNASDNQQHQININSANAEQLAQFLNGIGRKRRKRSLPIVNSRGHSHMWINYSKCLALVPLSWSEITARLNCDALVVREPP